MVQITMPTVVDDDGSLVYGTRFNAALWTLLGTAINALVHDSGNSTVTPADIIGEVVDARGSLGSLDARLDVSLNEDGTLKAQSSLATLVQAKSLLVARNLALNDDLSDWTNGGAAAPDNFTLSGTGAAVARCGPAQADTFSFDAGEFCAKLTYGSAAAKLTQAVIATADFSKYEACKGLAFVVGVKCKASVANQASIIVDDGVTTTRGGAAGNGSYHSGDGTEDWLYATHTISNSATKLEVLVETATSGAAYFGGFVFAFADIPPSNWSPLSVTPAANQTRGGLVSAIEQWFGGLKKFLTPPQRCIGGDTTTPLAFGNGTITRTSTAVSIAASGAKTVLASGTLKANMLNASGRYVRVRAQGTKLNNGNSKTLYVTLGSTDLVSYNESAAAANHRWFIDVYIWYTTSANAQLLDGIVMSGSISATPALQRATGAENLATDLTVSVQGASGAASADITLESCEITVN